MARVLDDFVGDDEIMVHAEAIHDGREPPPRLWPPVELHDDEIASHMEELLFTRFGARAGKARRAVRH